MNDIILPEAVNRRMLDLCSRMATRMFQIKEGNAVRLMFEDIVLEARWCSKGGQRTGSIVVTGTSSKPCPWGDSNTLHRNRKFVRKLRSTPTISQRLYAALVWAGRNVWEMNRLDLWRGMLYQEVQLRIVDDEDIEKVSRDTNRPDLYHEMSEFDVKFWLDWVREHCPSREEDT